MGHEQLDDLGTLRGAVGLHPRNLLALLDGALVNAAQCKTAEVRGRIEVGDVHLHRLLGVVLRRRNGLEQGLEQGLEVLLDRHAAVLGASQRSATCLGRGVDDREVDLLLGGVKIEEELVRLIDDLADARVRAIDLVDDEHDGQALLQCLAQHEAGLGQRALGCVNKQHNAVDHLETALDLAAEVSVTGGIDDVEGHATVGSTRAGVVNRGVLREDRDALLALEIHGVHDSVIDILVLAEGA